MYNKITLLSGYIYPIKCHSSLNIGINIMRRLHLFAAVCLLCTLAPPAAPVIRQEAYNVDQNAAFYVFDGSIHDIGWYYKPSHTYKLTRINTLFQSGSNHPNDVDRDVTIGVYTERPSQGGTLLASETFSTAYARNYPNGQDLDKVLTLDPGQTYFIGLLNVQWLRVNVAAYAPGTDDTTPPGPGITNLRYWASDFAANDGSFSSLIDPGTAVSPLFAQPILEFMGETIPPGFVCNLNPYNPRIRGTALPYTNTVDISANPLNAALKVGSNYLAAPGAFWRFEPPVAGAYYIETFGPFDTAFVLNSGDCCNQVNVLSQSANFAIGSEHAVATLAAGTTYTLIGRGYQEVDYGSLTVHVDGPLTTTTNNTCATPWVIDPAALPYRKTFNTWFNKSYYDLPGVTANGGSLGPDAWFSFTPTVTGPYDLRADGHGLDLALAVITGDCANKTIAAFADNGAVGERCVANLTAGVPYLILVEGFDALQKGEVTLSISAPGSPVSSANATCSSATLITQNQLPYTNTIDTTFNPNTRDNSAVLATQGGGGGHDAWWRFTPTTTGYYLIGAQQADTVDFTDAAFDLSLAVYTGGCGALTELKAVDDNYDPDELTSVSLQAGVEYLIQAEGFNAQNYGKMLLLLDGPLTQRPNNTCAGATNLNLPYGVSQYYVNTLGNIDTRRNEGTASRYRGNLYTPSPDAYLRFTPSETGLYSFELNTAFTPTGVVFNRLAGATDNFNITPYIDVAMAAYTDNCGNLQPIKAADDSYYSNDTRNGERMLLNIQAGQPFIIMVEGASGADVGPMLLTARGPLYPSLNGLCTVSNSTGDWAVYH
jgi:hypothetical protein